MREAVVAALQMAARVCSALSTIAALVILIAKPLRERVFGMDAIREGQKCMLRADMLATYYKYRPTRQIQQFAYENFLYEYKAYKALKGNSFIDRIHEELSQWEIVQ